MGQGHHRRRRIHDQRRYRDLRPLLVQRGELDLDAPVVKYWPEFGAAGKEQIPVRWLLSHQAGLPVVDGPLTFEEACAWDPVIRALEAQKPEWEPGTEHVYHSVTFGFLVGELVRRITGKSLGTLLRRRGRCPARAERLDRAARGARGTGGHGSSTPLRSRWRR